MKPKEVKFRIESITPLLMNNVHSMFEAKKKPARVKHDEWEQSDEMFRARMYLNSEGDKLALPDRVWFGMLREAAKGSGIKQPGKRSGYSDMVLSNLFLPAAFALLDQNVSDVVKNQAFVGMNGTKKVLRLWPMLPNWSATVSLIVADEKQFPVDILTELFDYAGKFIGMGDYRPQYGRFNVKKVS